MEEDFDRELKVLVIGNGGVGKTSMIRRFAKGIFTDEYKKTIGVDFLEKALFVDALQEEVGFTLPPLAKSPACTDDSMTPLEFYRFGSCCGIQVRFLLTLCYSLIFCDLDRCCNIMHE